MGTTCLIRWSVVLLVADDQRSYFMTNCHLPPVGVLLSFVRGLLVLCLRLATLSTSRYSGSSVSPTWRSDSYRGHVYPSSVAFYSRCISIVWESQFTYLAPPSFFLFGNTFCDMRKFFTRGHREAGPAEKIWLKNLRPSESWLGGNDCL